jgi:branched-chain amino acid transport system ATP-binding protein
MTELHVDEVVVLRGGRPVVKGVTLDVKAGEVTTLLGPNGAGKSSLSLAICGLLATGSGSIRIGEKVVSNLKPEAVRSAGVSVVPEGRRLLSDLTVEENLQAATYSLPKSVASAGLAPIVVKRLVPTLQEVADRGIGVLLIEQFAHIALSVAKRAYVMEGGQIRYDGTASELKEHPELLHSAYLLGNT